MVSTLDDSEPPPFRHYLKEWRIKRGLTQLELAQRLNTSKGLVSRWERGGRTIGIVFQLRIMRVLDIKPAQFFMDPDQPSADLLLEQVTPEERDRLINVLRMLIDPKR
jgi:transcriptional regulator with XRE-family HTH domain